MGIWKKPNSQEFPKGILGGPSTRSLGAPHKLSPAVFEVDLYRKLYFRAFSTPKTASGDTKFCIIFFAGLFGEILLCHHSPLPWYYFEEWCFLWKIL